MGGFDETKASCELVLEAFNSYQTLHASSIRGLVLGGSGLPLCLSPPSWGKVVHVLWGIKVCYSQLQSNKPVFLLHSCHTLCN